MKELLIDLDFVNSQAGEKFSNPENAVAFLETEGVNSDIAPNRLFHNSWYRWQNPDCFDFTDILSHFVEVGKRRIIDPSPYIDLVTFSKKMDTRTQHALFMNYGTVSGELQMAFIAALMTLSML